MTICTRCPNQCQSIDGYLSKAVPTKEVYKGRCLRALLILTSEPTVITKDEARRLFDKGSEVFIPSNRDEHGYDFFELGKYAISDCDNVSTFDFCLQACKADDKNVEDEYWCYETAGLHLLNFFNFDSHVLTTIANQICTLNQRIDKHNITNNVDNIARLVKVYANLAIIEKKNLKQNTDILIITAEIINRCRALALSADTVNVFANLIESYTTLSQIINSNQHN